MKKLLRVSKVLLMSIMLIAIVSGCTPAKAKSKYTYKTVTTDKLTEKMLTNRKGKHIIYVEKCVGVVVDNKKNGKVTNTKDKKYNYISYKSVKGAKKGNKIVTYLYYNPKTNYIDDIYKRTDKIMK